MSTSIKFFMLCCSTLWCVSSYADIHSHFNQIKNNPVQLYNFFHQMPKGGELHYHLAGGPSAETMLALVANKEYCIHPQTFVISKTEGHCSGISTTELTPDWLQKIIASWSMEGFQPGKESSHDHFFDSFMKFMPIVVEYRIALVADVLKHAGEQHELYMEIMDIPDDAYSATFGNTIKNLPTLAEKHQYLLADPAFQKTITNTVSRAEQLEPQAKESLQCTTHPQNQGCQVEARFLYYVLREQDLDSFIAQAVHGFEAVSRSKGALVGMNLVQAEDGVISLRDYQEQMQVFKYLHHYYPNVHIALHAGELTPQLVPAKELKGHIKDALFTGKAERIGHGTDIRYESNLKQTLTYMRQHEIPVEINQTSNLKILDIPNKDIPLVFYLNHQVPVVLSTDDEGILRTDLTTQYVNAAMEHHLSYKVLKQLNRNTLTYAFIAGASLWQHAPTAQPVTACLHLDSADCLNFIAKSPKAKLQWLLEKKLNQFEALF